ncbi:MAG: hypothetical protein ACLT2I_02385, partial [Corynebacterium variabile]
SVEKDAVELQIVDGGEGLVGPVTVLGQDVVIGSAPVRVEGTTTLVSEEDGLSESVPSAEVVFVEK